MLRVPVEFEVPGSFTTRVIDANMTGSHLCQIVDIVRISLFPISRSWFYQYPCSVWLTSWHSLVVSWKRCSSSYGTAGTGILSYGWSCYQDQPMRTVPSLYQSWWNWLNTTAVDRKIQHLCSKFSWSTLWQQRCKISQKQLCQQSVQ